MEIIEKEENELKRREKARNKYITNARKTTHKISMIFSFFAGSSPVIIFLVWGLKNNPEGLLKVLSNPLLVIGALIFIAIPLGIIIGMAAGTIFYMFLAIIVEISAYDKYPKTIYQKQKETAEARQRWKEEEEERKREKAYYEANKPDWALTSRCEELLNLLKNYDSCCRMNLDPHICECKSEIKINMYHDATLARMYCNILEEVLLDTYVDTLIQHPVGYRWVMAHKN